ncbi:hypothetical protein AWI07_08480 [Enterobacter roggenkampii]|nr:hypothetical protein AWI07_08480 [Enterobacter roggenkampii]
MLVNFARHAPVRGDIHKHPFPLRQPDVVALRGDWSQPSAFIADFLAKRNRYAIPFNAVYGPGLPDGEILSPLLDKRTLVTTLNNAKG